LRLFREGEAAPVAVIDDWGDALNPRALENASLLTGAFELPADSRDAALLVLLAPGVYSAHLDGVGGTSGIALVEIYAVN
jgi:hypothetical protein